MCDTDPKVFQILPSKEARTCTMTLNPDLMDTLALRRRVEELEEELGRGAEWEARMVTSADRACKALGVECLDEIPAAVARLKEYYGDPGPFHPEPTMCIVCGWPKCEWKRIRLQHEIICAVHDNGASGRNCHGHPSKIGIIGREGRK